MGGFDIEQWGLDNIDGAKVNGSKQIVGVCPWCGKVDKFYIDIETGKYICFSCEETGRRIVGVIAQVEGVTAGEAMKFMLRNQIEFRRKMDVDALSDKIIGMRGEDEDNDDYEEEIGVSFSESRNHHERVDEPLPKEFIPVWRNGKWAFPVYLKERRIKKNTAKEWNMGWARSGRYSHRVIIPIECPNGRSFTARDITGEEEQKYLNPYDVDHGKLLLGWYHTKVDGDLVLVEGPLDAVKMWQHGIPAVALLGKTLHKAQLEMLFAKPKDAGITIMLDPEEIDAPYKAADLLLCWFENVFIAKLPLGVDPGSSTFKQARIAMKKAVRYTGNRADRLASIVNSSATAIKNRY
jgi:hypothetical protein